MTLAALQSNERDALQIFIQKLERSYPGFKQVILYGSKARGDGTDDSDIDLAVVLRGKVVQGKEIDRMIDIITEISLKYDTLVSVYPISAKDYFDINSPLLINIRREGIAV